MSVFKDVNVVYCYVSDWEQSKKFYRKVLGWPVIWSSDEIGWEEYGIENATHVAINRWDDDKPFEPGSQPVAVLSVEDCLKVTEELRAKGVKCDEIIYIPGVVKYGTFYDPDGNRFQFASSMTE